MEVYSNPLKEASRQARQSLKVLFMSVKRKPQDAVVSNVKRLRAELRALRSRVSAIERAIRKLEQIGI